MRVACFFSCLLFLFNCQLPEAEQSRLWLCQTTLQQNIEITKTQLQAVKHNMLVESNKRTHLRPLNSYIKRLENSAKKFCSNLDNTPFHQLRKEVVSFQDSLIIILQELIDRNKKIEIAGVYYRDKNTQRFLNKMQLPESYLIESIAAISNKDSPQTKIQYLEVELMAWQKALQFCNFIASHRKVSCGPILTTEIISITPQPYVLLGDTFETEIAMGLRDYNLEVSINVDGEDLLVEDGVAVLNQKPTKTGKQQYTVEAEYKDPQTGEIKTLKQQFAYEVITPVAGILLSRAQFFECGKVNILKLSRADWEVLPHPQLEITATPKPDEFAVYVTDSNAKSVRLQYQHTINHQSVYSQKFWIKP